MSPEDIEKSLRQCLKENVYNVLANIAQNNPNSRAGGAAAKKHLGAASKLHSASATNLLQSAAASNHNHNALGEDSSSAQDHMELDLRDKLLDIAEQIGIGALGSLKVSDRLKWSAAIERGEYEPLCGSLTWGDGERATRPALERTNLPAGAEKRPGVKSIFSRLVF